MNNFILLSTVTQPPAATAAKTEISSEYLFGSLIVYAVLSILFAVFMTRRIKQKNKENSYEKGYFDAGNYVMRDMEIMDTVNSFYIAEFVVSDIVMFIYQQLYY